MTKTLTEQWREGKLPQGNYYIVIIGIEKEQMMIDYYIPELHHFEIKPSECIKEVLAPVPSYDEWKQAKENLNKNGTWYTERSYKRLEKQLEIATKALKDIRGWDEYDCMGLAKKALKEMEGVK